MAGAVDPILPGIPPPKYVHIHRFWPWDSEERRTWVSARPRWRADIRICRSPSFRNTTQQQWIWSYFVGG
eukprot:2264885-Pyramimonas_sp.AAC.1